jgi:hypothetical protein
MKARWRRSVQRFERPLTATESADRVFAHHGHRGEGCHAAS